jgi:hypothetical protein
MKGKIKPDPVLINKYEFKVVGMLPLLFTEVSGIEDELELTELPDRTVASTGERKAGTFTAMQPSHHVAEVVAMELWFKESQDPVSPLYKKPVTVVRKGSKSRIGRTLLGVFPCKRKDPDLDMSDEGTMDQIEWTFSFDDVQPL